MKSKYYSVAFKIKHNFYRTNNNHPLKATVILDDGYLSLKKFVFCGRQPSVVTIIIITPFFEIVKLFSQKN